MRAYELVLHEEAWAVLAAANRLARRRLMLRIEQLKKNPLGTGDFQESDADGRANEVLLVDDWLITFWADHAMREIRIVRLEPVAEE